MLKVGRDTFLQDSPYFYRSQPSSLRTLYNKCI